MVGKSAFEERDIRNVSAATQTHAYALITNLYPEQVQIRTIAQPFGDVGLNRAGANPKTRNTMLAEKMMDTRLVVNSSRVPPVSARSPARQSFQKYLPTLIIRQALQRQRCCRIAVHHPAYRWVCCIEEINTITTQICCFHFGNGMIGLIPGSEIGKKTNIFHQCLGLNTQRTVASITLPKP